MSLQEYTPWFNNPATNPIPKPFSRTGPHQTDAVFPEVDDSPYGAHVAPVHPYDKEPMFEKPLTPSDVGKLNRLVIPKMQAEKYFPLGGGAAAGTLLGFEDEDGKEWRFRYSFWNSSQSYVLTKGWSRYVKEKRLETGNVVFFERHRADPKRMFIGWRRPGSAPEQAGNFCHNSHWIMPYQYDSIHAPAAAEEQETTGGSSNSRRQVRLFGVNLECQVDISPSSQTTSSESSFFSTQLQSYQFYFGQNPHHM